jgi:hypothetical protein
MAMTARNSAWVAFYCGEDRQQRVATFRLIDGSWHLATVAGDIVEEGGDPGDFPVAGRFAVSPTYPGCPSCGNDSYIRCGTCGSLSCWKSSETSSLCGHCGHRGRVTGSIDSVKALDVG